VHPHPAAAQVQLPRRAGRPRPPRALHQVDDVAPLGSAEQFFEQASHAGRLGDAENAGGGAVGGGPPAERVEGDHAGGDRLQHGLRVPSAILELGGLVLEIDVSLLQLALGLAEVVGHPVERLHERADLVIAARLDLGGQVAGRHLARALGQLLDGAGDAAGQVQTEPRERENDDQGHQEEQQDVDALDRVLQELELLVLEERLRDAAHLLLEALGHVAADYHCAHHVPLPAARGPDGRHRLDEIAAGQLANRRDLLAGQAPAQLVLAQIAGGQIAEDGVLDVDQLLAGAVQDGDGADAQQVLLLDQEGSQHPAALLGQQVIAVDHAADVLPVADRGALQIRVVRLGDRQGLIERTLHLRLEPPLDRLVDEVGGDDEDPRGGRPRQHQECQNELGPETSAEHVLLALEPHLGQVSEQQHEQQQEDDQVQVEEGENYDVRRHRQLGREDAHVERGGAGDHHQEAGDDDDVALAAVLFAEQWHRYCTGTSVR